jgi:hypothetical protein
MFRCLRPNEGESTCPIRTSKSQQANGCPIRVASNDYAAAPNPNLSILQITPVVKRIAAAIGSFRIRRGSQWEAEYLGLRKAAGHSAGQTMWKIERSIDSLA